MWKPKWFRIKPWHNGAISASLVTVAICIAESLGGFQLLEWATLDLFFQRRPREPIDDRIVLVIVDESDLQHFGRWPLPDGVLSEAVRSIASDRPAAIGVNLYRDLPVEPGHSAWLDTLKSTPNLVGVEKIIGDLVDPPPILKPLDLVGFADFVLDGDGKVRRVLLSHPDRTGTLQLSFAVRLSLLYLEQHDIVLESIDDRGRYLRLGRAVFYPLNGRESGYATANAGGYQILANYRGSIEQFLQVSIRDVLSGRVPPETFRDRVVLVGSVAPSLSDFTYTPYSDGWLKTPHADPSLVVQANFVSQILSAALDRRPLLSGVRLWVEWIWTLCWAGVGAAVPNLFLNQRRRGRREPLGSPIRWGLLVGCTSIAISLPLLVSYGVFLGGLWLPAIAPATAVLGAAVLVTTNLIRRRQQESDRRLLQFLEVLPVGISVLEADGRVYYSNNTAEKILGGGVVPGAIDEAPSEALEQAFGSRSVKSPPCQRKTPSAIYINGTDLPYPEDQLPTTRALNGERSQANVLDVCWGERTVPLEMWGAPIFDSDGHVTFAVIAFQDITARQKADDEREQTTRELFELNQSLDRALAAELDLTDAAGRFVPHEFLSFLGYESLVDVELGKAVEKEMSVLFSDIRDFTTLSEQMSLEDNFRFINAYLSRMEPAIAENNGFIDKYIGDAIMALFGGSADDAVKAGIAMLEQLAAYNATRTRPDRPSLQIGVGINTGSLMLGTIGGKHHMDSTVISDAVNLAARIEDLTKVYGVPLLISHSTFLQLDDTNHYAIRLIDRVQVKGKSEKVSVFEVFDADPSDLKTGKIDRRTDFEQAVMLYHLKSYDEAARLFRDCWTDNSGDRASQIYLDRCLERLESERKSS
ncbi:MAG: CHASE2 domain-containing protein [Cyanobacteria bacterium SID2]|nr:CHASE2 domain-containing protein [Cyanobacteria bacterium SID2]